MDNKPFVNVLPFGLCTSLANPITAAQTAAALGVLTPGPCTPGDAGAVGAGRPDGAGGEPSPTLTRSSHVHLRVRRRDHASRTLARTRTRRHLNDHAGDTLSRRPPNDIVRSQWPRCYSPARQTCRVTGHEWTRTRVGRRTPRSHVVWLATSREETRRGATYLTPGVYVEEVASSSRDALRRGDRRRRVRRLHRQGADGRSDRPGRREAAPGHQLDPVREAVRRLRAGHHAAALGVRLLQQRRQPRLHRAHPEHRRRPTESGTLALPSGDRALGPAVEFTTVEPNADITVTVTPEPPADDAADDAPPTFRIDVIERRQGRRDFAGLTLGKGDRNVETVVNKESTKVKVATKIDVDAARPPTSPAIPAGIVRHRAGPAHARSPCPAGPSPAPRPPAPASTASSSPTTSRW